MPTITLTEAATRLAAKGTPWFFADDLAGADGPAGLVRILSDRGADLGLGFWSSRSRLRLRRCGPWPGDRVPPATEFFGERLAAAIARRAHLTEEPRGVRLVHGEADWLPGLIVDRYDRCLVLQGTSVVVEQHLSSIVPELRDRVGAEAVIARNDVAIRRREGLPLEVRLLDGRRVEEVTIQEHGVRHVVRPFTGQKTGFYLDQRPARRRVMQLAAELGAGASVLDVCSYQGGFALAALAGGAGRAVAVDSSATALELAARAATQNRLEGLRVEQADAFDYLRRARTAGESFDLVVLDPPPFARSRREVDGALGGYRDLNRLALRVLAPGGYLLTCSCSHHVTPTLFEQVLRQAAAELPFLVWLRQRIAAGEDHPVWLHLPESEYLKTVLLQRSGPADDTPADDPPADDTPTT